MQHSEEVRFAAVLLVFAALSFADTRIPDCESGKLSDYEKLGAVGCRIGDKTFSNFHYHQGVGGLPSDAISLTPDTSTETFEPGLLFEGKWASSSQDSIVSYNVAAQPNGKPISGASLEMQLGQITGSGKVTVLSDVCSEDQNAAPDRCDAEKLELKVVLSADNTKKPVDNVHFEQPRQAIHVVTPVDLAPGRGGSASLDSFMAVFQ